ncbi:hypothetical protein NB311A_12167 [Nitrobacter sp. Nb-311A]|uniref:hypothetical protein n=1 Tax=Nitrobacter sp. Nb-311A TaxID=314253 RepID=UPI00006852E7|nr:hypothetical protein [Nitrobacter sp. Nb-311A]EAQ34497.1 hypothetical protein NB311A_12167 [Nitrobacter sp. Nb-311A]
MTAVLSWLASLLTGPLLNKALDAYKAKLSAGNDADRIAADLATRELAVQQREIEVQSEYRVAALGHWYEPDKLMGYAVAVYVGKLLIYDKVLGLGSTDPLGGWIETTANLIVGFYFAKRGFENVARIIKK